MGVSWQSTTLKCSIEAIVRSHDGSVIGGSVKYLLAPSILSADAIAISNGHALAHSFPNQGIIIESDSSSLIKCLTLNEDPADRRAANIISQVWSSSQSWHINWFWTSKSANVAADHLAARGKCPADWLLHPPSSLIHTLLYDGCPGPAFWSAF